MKRPDRFKTFGGLVVAVLFSFLILSEFSYRIQTGEPLCPLKTLNLHF